VRGSTRAYTLTRWQWTDIATALAKNLGRRASRPKSHWKKLHSSLYTPKQAVSSLTLSFAVLWCWCVRTKIGGHALITPKNAVPQRIGGRLLCEGSRCPSLMMTRATALILERSLDHGTWCTPWAIRAAQRQAHDATSYLPSEVTLPRAWCVARGNVCPTVWLRSLLGYPA